jgi:hypothetical protein
MDMSEGVQLARQLARGVARQAARWAMLATAAFFLVATSFITVPAALLLWPVFLAVALVRARDARLAKLRRQCWRGAWLACDALWYPPLARLLAAQPHALRSQRAAMLARS